ncbi:Hypothetical protein KLENKIAIHU_4581 [Klenkia terrae]|nr:Hypothetical protein KLENKIAIHU_4581 [Klenkia terrae]
MTRRHRRAGEWTYTQTVNPETATIVVTGRVDHVSLDLLCATVEQLHNNGCGVVTVTLSGAADIQAGTVDALTGLLALLGHPSADLVVN